MTGFSTVLPPITYIEGETLGSNLSLSPTSHTQRLFEVLDQLHDERKKKRKEQPDRKIAICVTLLYIKKHIPTTSISTFIQLLSLKLSELSVSLSLYLSLPLSSLLL